MKIIASVNIDLNDDELDVKYNLLKLPESLRSIGVGLQNLAEAIIFANTPPVDEYETGPLPPEPMP
jgi:hypothetical protein